MNVELRCPICDEPLADLNKPCPCCSFEIHQTFPSFNKILEYEEKRCNIHKEWWNKLKEENVNRTLYEEKERELGEATARISELEQGIDNLLKSRKKPAAFLVTEHKTVYCLYEGVNTFGSAKTNPSCEQHQKIIIPGVMVLPIYFSIDVQAIDVQDLDKGYHCTICELSTEASTLYINTTTNPVGKGLPIMDGDEIVVAISGSDCKIKFRTNIN